MSIQNIIYNKILSSQQINNSEEIQYLNEDSKKIAQELIENNNSEGLLYPADLAVHHTVDNAFHYNSLLYIFIIIGLGKLGYDFYIDAMYAHMIICSMSIIAIGTLLLERFRLSMWKKRGLSRSNTLKKSSQSNTPVVVYPFMNSVHSQKSIIKLCKYVKLKGRYQ
jgi:hypothetical protein